MVAITEHHIMISTNTGRTNNSERVSSPYLYQCLEKEIVFLALPSLFLGYEQGNHLKKRRFFSAHPWKRNPYKPRIAEQNSKLQTRAAPQGANLRGQTKICDFLSVPVVFCGFQRQLWVFSENVRFPSGSFSGNLQYSAFRFGLSP